MKIIELAETTAMNYLEIGTLLGVTKQWVAKVMSARRRKQGLKSIGWRPKKGALTLTGSDPS